MKGFTEDFCYIRIHGCLTNSPQHFVSVFVVSAFEVLILKQSQDWIFYEMKSRNRTAPNNASYNKYSNHGILTLPLCIMLPFGLLGLKPGQLFNKIIGYVISTMFLFNYGLILTITVARFYNVKDYKDTLAKFFTGFAVIMTIKFTILIYIYFKRYNFLCMLEDLTNLRKHSLSKK